MSSANVTGAPLSWQNQQDAYFFRLSSQKKTMRCQAMLPEKNIQIVFKRIFKSIFLNPQNTIQNCSRQYLDFFF